MFSQWSCTRIEAETDERLGSRKINLAATRRTDCNLAMRHLGDEASTPLQLSIRLWMSALTKVQGVCRIVRKRSTYDTELAKMEVA